MCKKGCKKGFCSCIRTTDPGLFDHAPSIDKTARFPLRYWKAGEALHNYYLSFEDIALKVNNTPVGYVPTTSGNTTDLNTVVIDSSGDKWIIDILGNAIKMPIGGGGTGTVTSFSSGDLSPLFTTSVATPTTTPALSFTLSTTSQYSVFGRSAAGTGVPSWITLPSTAFTGYTAGTGISIIGNVIASTASPVAWADKAIAFGKTSSGGLTYDSYIKYDYNTQKLFSRKVIIGDNPTTGGSTGSENLYNLQVNMDGGSDLYGFTVRNGAIDPWFHVNSNGIGAVGDGTTIPFFSIEADYLFSRELRSHIVPAGDYSYMWAKATTGNRNDLQLWGNKDIILQAGRSNAETNINGTIWMQSSFGVKIVKWGSLTSDSATVFDNVSSGARMYQFDNTTTLKNLIQATGNSFILDTFSVGRNTATSTFHVGGDVAIDSLLNDNALSNILVSTGVPSGVVKYRTVASLPFTNNSGTVTSVSAGNGMSFTTITATGAVIMGTPSSISLASTNNVSTGSHTHAFIPGGTSAQYIRGDGVLATYTGGLWSSGGAGTVYPTTGTKIGLGVTTADNDIHLKVNTVDGLNNCFQLENSSAAGTYKFLRIGQMGSNGHGFATLQSAGFVESYANGGFVFSVANGDFKVLTTGSRTLRMSIAGSTGYMTLSTIPNAPSATDILVSNSGVISYRALSSISIGSDVWRITGGNTIATSITDSIWHNGALKLGNGSSGSNSYMLQVVGTSYFTQTMLINNSTAFNALNASASPVEVFKVDSSNNWLFAASHIKVNATDIYIDQYPNTRSDSFYTVQAARLMYTDSNGKILLTDKKAFYNDHVSAGSKTQQGHAADSTWRRLTNDLTYGSISFGTQFNINGTTFACQIPRTDQRFWLVSVIEYENQSGSSGTPVIDLQIRVNGSTTGVVFSDWSEATTGVRNTVTIQSILYTAGGGGYYDVDIYIRVATGSGSIYVNKHDTVITNVGYIPA